MTNKFYNFGEPITSSRMEDEPWYSDYQAVCEVKTSGPRKEGLSWFEHLPNGKKIALEACKSYFRKFPGPPGWKPPSDERIMRWIDSMWQTEETIHQIELLKKQEL